MSIFKVLSTLNNLAQKVTTIKSNVNQGFNEESLNSIESELEALYLMNFDSFDFSHAATEGELEFQFPYRLKDIKDSIDKEKPSTKKLFSSPVKPFRHKSEHPSPQKTASPVKAHQLLFRETDFSLRQNVNERLEQGTIKSLSTEKAHLRISEIEGKIKALLVRLEEVLQTQKEISKKLFMEHAQNNHKNDKEVLDDLFDMVHKDNGIFEEVARKLTQKRLQAPEKSFAENRQEIIENKTLFQTLGKVDVQPKNYFELTSTSDELARAFIERLYQSPEQLEVMLQFQQAKEKGMRFNFLNTILKISEKSLCNEFFLYRVNAETQERVYIKSVSEEDDLNNIRLDSKEEMLKKTMIQLTKEAIKKRVDKINEAVELIHRKFNGATTAKTCISFFPICIEHSDSTQPEYVCLVTTSGELQKLDKKTPNNIQALKKFQDMIQSFVNENCPSQTIDGVSYTFKYHAEEKAFIDLALQQINKGLSGEEQPLSTTNVAHASLLIKPLRACAEKKFIAYVRERLVKDKHIKSLQIMGAANLSMPILPTPEQVEPQKKAYAAKKRAVTQDPLMAIHQGLWLKFYTNFVDVVKKPSDDKDFKALTNLLSSLDNPNDSINKNLENFTVDKSKYIIQKELVDFKTKARRAITVALKNKETDLNQRFLGDCEKQFNKLQQEATIPKPKGPTDTFTFTTHNSSKKEIQLSTKFIDCCDGCQSAKLPVLVALTHFLPMHEKQPVVKDLSDTNDQAHKRLKPSMSISSLTL